jgi:hypothetical protein
VKKILIVSALALLLSACGGHNVTTPQAPAPQAKTDGMPATLTERLAAFDEIPAVQNLYTLIPQAAPTAVAADDAISQQNFADYMSILWAHAAGGYSSHDDPRLLWGIVEDPTSDLGQYIARTQLWTDGGAAVISGGSDTAGVAGGVTRLEAKVKVGSYGGQFQDEPMTWYVKVVQNHHIFVGIRTQEGSFGNTS